MLRKTIYEIKKAKKSFGITGNALCPIMGAAIKAEVILRKIRSTSIKSLTKMSVIL